MSKYSINTVNGISFVQFNHINRHMIFRHGFSCRDGGISPIPYSSLNNAFTGDDHPDRRKENRRRFAGALEFPLEFIPRSIKLEHGRKVIVIDNIVKENLPLSADGAVTSLPDFPLAATFADCIPIILADPVKRAAGVLHAGWRGTLAGIAQEGVHQMIQSFGSNPDHILAGIAPGIGPCCFEVHQDTAFSFLDKYSNWEDLILPLSNIKYKIDLWGINQRILIGSGLKPENVIIADLCTCCRKDLFFSYRRDGVLSGRMMAAICIINDNDG